MLKVFRVVRIFRLFGKNKDLQAAVSSMIKSFRSIGSSMILSIVWMYMFVVRRNYAAHNYTGHTP